MNAFALPTELLEITLWGAVTPIAKQALSKRIPRRNQMSHKPKSDPCREGNHEDCDRLAWVGGDADAVYCGCDCGCDGIGQESLV